jgi:hypothetical protein
MDGKRPVFAVDLDGTLAQELPEYDDEKIGDPIEGAKEFLSALSKMGEILIYSCRTSSDAHQEYKAMWNSRLVRTWLKENSMMFDEVYMGHGKPIADVYIDDRAVSCEPLRMGPAAYTLALKAVTRRIE